MTFYAACGPGGSAERRVEASRAASIGRLLKTILCFGDSNTWGYVPGTDGGRGGTYRRRGGGGDCIRKLLA